MKKYIKFAAGLLLMTSASSCGGFLDEYSQDMVVAKTVSHFNEVLLGNGYIGSYSVSSGPTIGSVGGFFNVLDDDINMGSVGYETPKSWGNCLSNIFGCYAWQLRIGSNYNASNFSSDAVTWNDLYARINVLNIILDEIEFVPHDTDDDIRIYYRVKGEAHFLRGYFFFILANLYGDAYDPATASQKLCVPLKLTPYIEHDKNKDTQFTRATVKEVYDQIVLDLSLAEEFLTTSPQDSSFKLHRASFESIELLFSRVYLYMQDWELAEEKADAVLGCRGVSLAGLNYLSDGPFLTRDNPEILFSQGPNYLCPTDLFTARPGDFCVSQNLREIYDDNDMRAKCFFGKHSLSDSITLTNKYDRGIFVSHVSDAFVLRTAEAYLNKAEACAMQPGKEQKACDALNRLRQNRIENYTSASYTGEELVNQVRDERRKELCFEGHRWFDLRRYAVNTQYPYSKSIVHSYHACGDAGVSYSQVYVLEEHDPAYTFALPEAVIQFDNVPMPDNPRKNRNPLKDDDDDSQL